MLDSLTYLLPPERRALPDCATHRESTALVNPGPPRQQLTEYTQGKNYPYQNKEQSARAKRFSLYRIHTFRDEFIYPGLIFGVKTIPVACIGLVWG